MWFKKYLIHPMGRIKHSIESEIDEYVDTMKILSKERYARHVENHERIEKREGERERERERERGREREGERDRERELCKVGSIMQTECYKNS